MGTFTKHRNFGLLLALLFLGTWGGVKGQYCIPGYTNGSCTSGDFIDYVGFVSINNNNTGCNNTSGNYTDFSSTLSANVAINQTYTIEVRSGTQFGQYFAAFIDLNQDQDFDDAGEFFDIGYSASGTQISSTITIPGGSTPGTTRLRVLCRYSTSPLVQTDVCSQNLSWGEVEDYGLVIAPPSPLDLAMLDLQSPSSNCSLGPNETVTVQFANFGTSSASNPTVCYAVNNGTPVCETYTGTIPAGDTVTYTFTAPVSIPGPGQYFFDTWTTLAGDGFAPNDSLTGQLVEHLGQGLVNSLPYSEDFESGANGWTTYGDPTTNTWQLGTPVASFIPAAASGSNAWVTNLTGNYNDNELSYLQSPCLDFSGLTADPFVAFSHIYNTESCCDESWLEMSTDAGQTWAKVGASGTGNNWYNDSFAEEWDGDSGPAGAWRTADNRLDGAAGQSGVFLRYVFSSDGSVVREGFGVDDVRILDTILNVGASLITSPVNGCQLSASETVTVEIFNAGTHDASNFPVCFTVNGGTPVCETVPGPIQPGATLAYTFTGTADLSVSGPYDIAVYCGLPGDSISDNDTTSQTVVSFPTINTFPYVEDFEGGQGDWTSDGTNNDWGFGTPNKLNIFGAASGINAWVTGTTGFLNYSANQDSWVESPCFDMTNLQAPWVGANVWWESEGSFDGAVLEYSTDGGGTWNEVGTTGDPFNWYNDNSLNGLSNAGLSGNGWGGQASNNAAPGQYVFAKHDIGFLSGQSNVRFRMHFGSEGSVQFDGIAFDDFTIARAPTVDLGADTIVCTGLTLAPNLPLNGTFEWDSISAGFPFDFDTTNSVNIVGSGVYALTYTDSLGICGFDTIAITINTTPQVDLGPDQNICDGSTTTLFVDSLAYPTVNWSNSSTGGSIAVGTTGQWIVDVVDTVSCVSSDTINTTVVPLPVFSLGADTSVCNGDTFCLTATPSGPGFTYLWSTGATTQTICSQIPAGYWAIATDSNGCSWADSVIYSLAAQFVVANGNFDTTNCPVVNFSDQSSGATFWSWDFGDGSGVSTQQNPSYDYTAAGGGNYQVTLIAGNACGADTTTISVDITCLVNLQEGLDARLQIFPNPNQGRFRVVTELGGTVPVQVSITDLRGKLVLDRDFGTASGTFEEEISLDPQASGVYFVRFRAGDKVQVEKIIVE